MKPPPFGRSHCDWAIRTILGVGADFHYETLSKEDWIGRRLLAGCLQGWVPAPALAAYQAERLPITEQVSRFAMNHAMALQKERDGVPGNIEDPGATGDAARAAAGKALYDLNVRQYCCAGLNFGYFYDASPLIAYDGECAPGYTMDRFTPSTVPGCRTPHAWLDNGRSLYDALGRGSRCCG